MTCASGTDRLDWQVEPDPSVGAAEGVDAGGLPTTFTAAVGLVEAVDAGG